MTGESPDSFHRIWLELLETHADSKEARLKPGLFAYGSGQMFRCVAGLVHPQVVRFEVVLVVLGGVVVGAAAAEVAFDFVLGGVVVGAAAAEVALDVQILVQQLVRHLAPPSTLAP